METILTVYADNMEYYNSDEDEYTTDKEEGKIENIEDVNKQTININQL